VSPRRASILIAGPSASGKSTTSSERVELRPGEAPVWFPKSGADVVHVKAPRGTGERPRHVRLYAEGELSAEQSFYFRGPDSKLKLRAQNLKTFLRLAEGVDGETWMFHLRNGGYSAWFEPMIKDEELKRQAGDRRTGSQSLATGESRANQASRRSSIHGA
jgi:hypothetical protein